MQLTANQHPTGTNSGKRIEYIDAMRGFTMILVVFYHVGLYCWNTPLQVESLHKYCLQVRMPLFFFISGFVLYKASVVWNLQQVVKFFRKKIPVQLLAPFVFFLIFIHVKDYPLMESIEHVHKKGYWFTFVLLEYYVFYAGIRFLIRNEKVSSIVLIVLGLILYFMNWDHVPIPSNIKGILSVGNWHRFLFFVMGTLVKKNFSTVERFLDTKWLLPCCIAYYFIVNAFSDLIPVEHFSSPLQLTLTLTGLTILFSFFRNKQDVFKKETTLGNCLQYIGRRTLDVYLIHFFLLPENLSFVTVFVDHPMPIIEATASLAIALIIIAGCLLISNIIRLSPVLAHWVFGAKYPNPK